jgi:succinyl-CoA synthetase alpha subunit
MKRVKVRKDSYFDSVFLMQLSKGLKDLKGVSDAVVTMGTPMNLELLAAMGYPGSELTGISPNDLVTAVDCPDAEAVEAAFAAASEMLARKRKAGSSGQALPSSIAAAVELLPGANLAIISLPGAFAPREARKALGQGLHVMLFSDNVAFDDEVALKALGRDKGLLVMGPDCGTAIIDGKPLCFANVVRRGSVGVVAASGTGLQEVTCIIDRQGSGISQAIGTGGRDLKSEVVGGTTMLMAIAGLARDAATKVIVVVSKPPAPSVAARVVEALEASGKPCVAHFIGLRIPEPRPDSRIRWASSLEEAAVLAAGLDQDRVLRADREGLDAIARREASGLLPAQRKLRGYYTGGTLADEAMLLLHRQTGSVWSNNQTDPAFILPDPKVSIGHTVVDLGDDVFTVGRPHPMIDPSTRTERLLAERDDASIAVVLVDVVLGYGSHEDPAAALLPALLELRKAAQARGGYLPVVVALVGTPGDYQGFEGQKAKLEAAGCVVCLSNFRAASLAARIVAIAGGQSFQEAAIEAPHAGFPDAGGRAFPATAQGGHGDDPLLDLFSNGLKAVNLGLESFADNLRAQGAEVVQVDWKPPAGGDAAVIAVLDRIEAKSTVDIPSANALAVDRIQRGKPTLIGVGRALDTVPGMTKKTILHSGPPVTWERMCGPMRGAVIGGLLYEGLVTTRQDAEALAASGEIAFDPCHHHNAVGPMAGVMTAGMPVWIFENTTFGNRAYCSFNEGLGKVLRYGAFSEEVLARLKWIETDLAPVMAKALAAHGPLDMKNVLAQVLQMGDEGHNRNRAGTSLIIREFAPWLVRLGEDPEKIARVLSFMHANDHFFLNLSMPACKCTVDAARDIEGSTVIVAMARNGTDFGIRVSGLGDRWFTGPAGIVEGLYLPGFGPADAAPDIGDSVITETAGIGGFAMAAAPAIVQFVGGTPDDALAITRRMYEITLAENEVYRIPILDFRGTPTAIDLRKVVETGILPAINTGIAHREPGVGMVGAGLVKPPANCFRDALAAFADTYC